MSVSGLSLSMGLSLTSVYSIGGAAPGQPLAAVPIAPATRYHPAFSAITEAAGRITAVSDLRGLAAATEAAAGIGPRMHTDLRGWKCFRFAGDSALAYANSLTLGTQASGVFIVGRVHKVAPLYQTFLSLGTVSGGTAASSGQPAALFNGSSGTAPFLGNGGQALTNKAYLMPGSNVQVMGWVNRPGASAGVTDSGQRVYINNKAANVPALFSVSAAGGEIGRYSFAPGSSGYWASFDAYDILLYSGTLTDAQADSIVAALTSAYGISEFVNRVVIEGDSRLDGFAQVPTGDNITMVATEPGASWAVPADTQVISYASSGSTTDSGSNSMLTRRDITDSVFNYKLPGWNRVAFMIGVNDFYAASRDAPTTYAHLVPLLNTTTTGYLQRGWEARVAVEMANGNAEPCGAYRTLERATQFLSDTLSGPGQTYEGRVKLIETPLITLGGATLFNTPTDAANATYYQGDSLHPSVLGTKLLWTGADTPQYGLRGVLDAGPPQYSLAGNVSQAEGNSGTTNFAFTVNRFGVTTASGSVDWAVTGSGTNPASASDFVGGVFPSGTATFAANATSATITVPVAGDAVNETDETFTVTLSNVAGGGSIGVATATGTITNDDAPAVSTFYESVFRATAGAQNGYTGYGTTVDEIVSAKTYPQTSLRGNGKYGVDQYDPGVFSDNASGDSGSGGLYSGYWSANYNGHFLKFDLAPGTYKLWAHIADAGNARAIGLEIWSGLSTTTPGFPNDAGNTLLAQTLQTLPLGNIMDAAGNILSAANFPANQQPLTFTVPADKSAIYLTTSIATSGKTLVLNWVKITS